LRYFWKIQIRKLCSCFIRYCQCVSFFLSADFSNSLFTILSVETFRVFLLFLADDFSVVISISFFELYLSKSFPFSPPFSFLLFTLSVLLPDLDKSFFSEESFLVKLLSDFRFCIFVELSFFKFSVLFSESDLFFFSWLGDFFFRFGAICQVRFICFILT